jgi:hypothetical protein
MKKQNDLAVTMTRKIFEIRTALVAFAFIFAAAVNCHTSAAPVDEKLNSATYPSPIVLEVHSDGWKYFAQVEPITWRTLSSNNTKTIENGKVYIFFEKKVERFFVQKSERNFYPVESFPTIYYMNFRNMVGMKPGTIGKQQGIAFPNDYANIAVCPSEISNPQVEDCLFLGQAKYTLLHEPPYPSSVEYRCETELCSRTGLQELSGQLSAARRRGGEPQVEFYPIDQTHTSELVDKLKSQAAAYKEYVKQIDTRYEESKIADAKAKKDQADAFIKSARPGAQLACNTGNIYGLGVGKPLTSAAYTCDATGPGNIVSLSVLLANGWHVIHENRTPVEGMSGNTIYDVSLILEKK